MIKPLINSYDVCAHENMLCERAASLNKIFSILTNLLNGNIMLTASKIVRKRDA